MPNAEKYRIRPAKVSDFEELAALMVREEDNPEATASYLEHWFAKQPFQSYAMAVAVSASSQPVGIAATNNYLFDTPEGPKLVAMPQKVLTSRHIRRKGFFSKLYRLTEQTNLEQEKVDFFLTFHSPANKQSSAIFRHKLNYQQGIAPRLVALPFNPFYLLFGTAYCRVDSFEAAYFQQHTPVKLPWAVQKDYSYYQWRYTSGELPAYIKLKVTRKTDCLGYVVLRKYRKKGITCFLLLDVITHRRDFVTPLIRQACVFNARQRGAAIILARNDLVNPSRLPWFRVRVPYHFNFLVKGRDEAWTDRLKRQKFNIFLGDMDFV